MTSGPIPRPFKTLFFFDGGLGDAISLAILFNNLESKYNFRVSVACGHDILEDILKPLGFKGDWHNPPIELGLIHRHDRLQMRADAFFYHKHGKWSLCIAEELGSAYNIEMDDSSQTYFIPETVIERTLLPAKSGPRIGINFDSRGMIRSYPEELRQALLNLLSRSGFEIFLLGSETPAISGVPDIHSVHDYRGTTSVPELAAIILQMDLMICVDSFIAHLSNILKNQYHCPAEFHTERSF